MPAMTSKYFARSVIYMCMHNAKGAMGLIINQRAGTISFPKLLRELGVLSGDDEDAVPVDILSMPVQIGGPVETGRGFVLHSSDYSGGKSTMAIQGGVCLTNTIDILKSMARGRGPEQAIMALGYAGWGAGQLESELAENAWLVCEPDSDLVFGDAHEHKWRHAMTRLGVDLSRLHSGAGNA